MPHQNRIRKTVNCGFRIKSLFANTFTFSLYLVCNHLTLYQTSPVFENTVGKEIAGKEQFLHFPQCFLRVWKTFCHFHQKLKLSFANSLSLEESIICRLGKG